MVLDDWGECPSCHFSALHSAFVEFAVAEGTCPMCDAAVAGTDVILVKDPSEQLKRAKGAAAAGEGGDDSAAAAAPGGSGEAAP